MNADGGVAADMRRKLKQVLHLLGLFRTVMERVCAQKPSPVVWDFNCGSSYLGLLLSDDAFSRFGRRIRLFGVDRDPARVDACRRRAAAADVAGAEFVHADTAEAALRDAPDLVLSLHGCDVATDAALKRAVEAGAPEIAAAPCCHRELRGLLRTAPPHDLFLRDGIVADDYAALLTDVARADALRAAGYRAEIIEFTSAEHSAQNRLIRASLRGGRDAAARGRVDAVVAACTAAPAFSFIRSDRSTDA